MPAGPFTLTVRQLAAIGDDEFNETLTVEGGLEGESRDIPAAKTGVLTTRTDNDTGTFTMDSGHGFSTSDLIDVYWTSGTRRGMTATVTGDSVVLDGGSGDNLPSAATSITAMKPVEYPFTVDGDTIKGLAIYSAQPGWITFWDDTGTPAIITPAIYRFDAAGGHSWIDSDDAIGAAPTNPLAGEIVTLVKFSHGYSSGTCLMKAMVIKE